MSKMQFIMILAAVSAVACVQKANKPVDTTAATPAPAVPETLSVRTESVAAAGAGASEKARGGVSNRAAESRSVKPAPVVRSARSRDSRDSVSRDTSIIGRDSVLRFPYRPLPTASSTPIRK